MKQKFDYESFHRKAFEDALAEIPNGHGRRNVTLLPRAAYHAVKLGMDANDYAAQVVDASAGCDPLTPSEIMRAFQTAAAKIGSSTTVGKFRRQSLPIHMGCPDYVPHLIAKGGDAATAATLRAMSPVNVAALASRPEDQTEAFLRLLWHPDDWLYLFSIEHPTSGVPGMSLRKQSEWIEQLVRGPIFLDGLVPNPFTGQPQQRPDGTPSYITKDCLSEYPYAVIEFDGMSLSQQCALWVGFLSSSKYRDRLASLTYLGGKSIHALFRIGAKDQLMQSHWRRVLTDLFASNSDPSLCADKAGLTARQGTRLPGVRRDCTGPVQELLYLNPSAVSLR